MSLSRIFGPAVLAAALAACSSAPPPAVETKTAETFSPQDAALKPAADRRPAPEFSLKDASGVPVTIAGYKGKVVLLNFWATWCAPCKAEMPWFQEFESKYKDRGFAVLGASLDEDGWDVVKPYIDEHKINYRIFVATNDMAQLYGVIDALPATFMIDREGRIAAIHNGLVNKATYVKQIEELLENRHAALRRTELAADTRAGFRAN
jgi:peroxiredoxin